VREEDDTIIVPVVEEVLTLQRTLILKEEVRIRKVRTEERYQGNVALRSQQAAITRLPVEEDAAAESAAVGRIGLERR
jgi:stress response protein YsnF